MTRGLGAPVVLWIGVGIVLGAAGVAGASAVRSVLAGPAPSWAARRDAVPIVRPRSGAVAIAGSGSNLPVTRALVEAYRREHPSARLVVHESIGSTGGVRAVAEGAIDLGAELGDLFGAQAAVEEPESATPGTEFGDAGLADIFKEFKAGVDKQLGKEDYDTRYNLGIAYKEMGLIDEAIAEFQLAAKDEARLLECSSMLGICFLEKGMPKLAVKWFERGLKAPGRTDDEYVALRYDLAAACEAAGDTDRALSLFTDLYGQDANYRDVASKVRELRGAAR